MDLKTFENNYVWDVIKSYFDENNLVSNQISSMNHFYTFGMQEIVDQEPPIVISDENGKKYEARFGQISLSPPQIIEEDRTLKKAYPMDARSRDLNYDSAIHIDISETHYNGDTVIETKDFTRVLIGRMPIMLRSSMCNLTKITMDESIKTGECPNDCGGYFIIKGNERVLVAQIRANYNHVFVLPRKSDDKYKYVAEVRSMSTETGHSVLVQAMIGVDDRSINFSLPCINEHIPVGVVFKALGYMTDEDISGLIGLSAKGSEKYIKYIIRDAYFCNTQKDALKYIGQFAIHTIDKDRESAYAWQVVESEIFPHLGVSGTIKEQACFLGHIIRKLIATNLKIRDPDDRDNYSVKRVEIAGTLMYEIFRNLFKKFVSFISLQIAKRKQRPDILSMISRIKNITKGLHQCLSTGNWSVQKNASYVRTGVSQILDRMTYGATLSHLRRIRVPIGKEGKNAPMRQIHASQFGYICPCETPEGQKVGVVLNFSMMCQVTRKIQPVTVMKSLDRIKGIIGVNEIEISNIKNCTSIYLNSVLIGFTECPEEIVKSVKTLRTKRILSNEISVTFDIIDNDIRIYCDEGRFIRPLFCLNNNKIDFERLAKYKDNWYKLVKKEIVHYVDASEIENCVIAMNPLMLEVQHNDYCEIHPSMMLGVMASIIPFPDHSQSPRNCYQSSMGKQALGMPALSYNMRTDTMLHVLHYAQRPIVSTRTSNYMKFNEMPSGINAIVAVMCYNYNQEDSIVINADSIQRGMFGLTSYFTIDECEKKRDTYSNEKICLPPLSSNITVKIGEPKYFRRKYANYSLLNENGIIMDRVPLERQCVNRSCGTNWFDGNLDECPKCKKSSDIVRGGGSIHVKKGDVIIGKIIVTGTKSGEESIIDVSRVIQEDEEGIVDRVTTSITPNGYNLVKIRIRKIRVPIMGDKLASRAAQKGTIGLVCPASKLPFTENGIVPDIIINSLCMPSRMTINQLVECALGKACVINGEYGDATPFTQYSVDITNNFTEQYSKVMEDHGLDMLGWEKMYNGETGEEINAKIFMGPTYYQRLKHMVSDKMHARARGHVTMLTRQPLEGRSRDGGLRFGEMERDCMIAHGTSRFLKERLFEQSDYFQIYVCTKCGVMTSSTTECQVCKSDRVVPCNYPYASKLLTQELMGMGIEILIHPDI